MATNPFDFTGVYDLQEVFGEQTKAKLRLLEQQGMPPYKAYDLLYDAIEAPAVNPYLKRQAIEVCEIGAVKLAEDICNSVIKTGLDSKEIVRRLRILQPEVLTRMLADTQQAAQQSIRITRSKGEADTNPLLREIAREAAVLSEAQRGNLVTMMDAFRRAHQRTLKPPKPPVPGQQDPKPVRRKPNGKPGQFNL